MSTKPDSKVLFDLARETLQKRGWEPDVIGNHLTHPNLPGQKIRLHYTGGQIFIHGWIPKGDDTILHWDTAETTIEVVNLAHNIDLKMKAKIDD